MRLRNSGVARAASLALVGLLGAACGDGSGDTSGAGGSVATGGGPGAGGIPSTGGAVTTGGTIAPGGGAPGNGGGFATGGSATGGFATGGSATGGVNFTGGSNTGGQPSGGDSSVGGAATGGQGTGGDSTPSGCLPAPTTYPNLFVTVSGHTQQESDSKVADAWSKLFNASSSGTIYFNGPGADESYVKDIWNGDVRSEGMSYGMMAAVQLDHQTEFDRLWTWVRNHMAQGCSGDVCTGEVAWSCSTSGSKNSNGGAPDGEEYMAMALIFAQNRWGDGGKFKYGTEAKWVLDLIRTKYFHTNPHLVKFVTNSNKTDPSYILPSFYQAWACFDPDNAEFWNTAITDGREFFHVGVDGNGICPYQASWDGSQPQAANSDSLRCVMNLMMDHNFYAADPWQTETYAPMYAASQGNTGVPGYFCNATLGFGLPAAQGKAFVDRLWSANVPSSNYWDGVLYMLSLLHVSGTFKMYY